LSLSLSKTAVLLDLYGIGGENAESWSDSTDIRGKKG